MVSEFSMILSSNLFSLASLCCWIKLSNYSTVGTVCKILEYPKDFKCEMSEFFFSKTTTEDRSDSRIESAD